MPDDLPTRIDINPQVMLGKPVIRGTRITVLAAIDQAMGRHRGEAGASGRKP